MSARETPVLHANHHEHLEKHAFLFRCHPPPELFVFNNLGASGASEAVTAILSKAPRGGEGHRIGFLFAQKLAGESWKGLQMLKERPLYENLRLQTQLTQAERLRFGFWRGKGPRSRRQSLGDPDRAYDGGARLEDSTWMPAASFPRSLACV